jgi:cell division transport system permease protein
MKRSPIFNMHFTTTISVSLVLFLIGLECVVMMSARELVRQVRENMVVTIVLEDETTSDEVSRMQMLLNKAAYCLDAQFISREEALQEHITNLGEDPQKFLGYNPLTDAFEIHLQEVYTSADSIRNIEQQLLALPYVSKVIYHKDVVSKLDKNLSEISIVLLAVALALLVIALVLISNTIQLQVYSKRFIINTMRLVGATPWVIKWPFIRRNVWLGLQAAFLACAMIALAYYYCVNHLGIVLFTLTKVNLAFLISVVVLSGIIITFLASLAATNRYIRMKTNKLYEI